MNCGLGMDNVIMHTWLFIVSYPHQVLKFLCSERCHGEILTKIIMCCVCVYKYSVHSSSAADPSILVLLCLCWSLHVLPLTVSITCVLIPLPSCIRGDDNDYINPSDSFYCFWDSTSIVQLNLFSIGLWHLFFIVPTCDSRLHSQVGLFRSLGLIYMVFSPTNFRYL